MNAEIARKILGLQRQRIAVAASVKRGQLLEREADALVADITRQIVALRSQGELELPVKTTEVPAKGK